MTISLPLEPQDEAKLMAAAKAKGISTDEFVRSALESVLAAVTLISDTESSGGAMGDALVAAMQASPCREINLFAARSRPPVRDIVI